MKLLCINSGEHSCTLAYMVDGKLQYALEEERFARVKASTDFTHECFRHPVSGLEFIHEKSGVLPRDVDHLIMTCPYKGLSGFRAWFHEITNWDATHKFSIDDFPDDKIVNIDHHFAHCNLAYFTSGFPQDEQVLVMSMDAAGGDYSAKYYIGYQNHLSFIDGIDMYRKSFGHFYAALTELLGFARLKDEGKVVGLAGRTSDIHSMLYEQWAKILELDPHRPVTKFDSHSHRMTYGGLYEEFFSAFYSVWGSSFWKSPQKMQLVASTGQRVFEDGVLRLIDKLHTRYPNIKRLALSGGCFANVKLNQRVNELDWVEEVYITPPMGDEGLSWGSCIATQQKLVGDVQVQRLNDVFLGASYDDEIESVATEYTDVVDISLNNDVPLLAARLLKDGYVCAIYQGRSEHGPRALGNRSILVDPRGHNVTYEKLNGILKRNDFMPFAPAVLSEYADVVFDVKKSKYTAEFMTMCYDTKPKWVTKIPLVVHPVDKTARIQIVTASSNLLLYKIMREFHHITDVPVLLNTSFNVHNEPIVNSPHDAFTHLQDETIQFLITPNHIYQKKEWTKWDK